MDSYRKFTGRTQVLPFYHTVYEKKKPHFAHLNFSRSIKRFREDLDYLTTHFENVPIERAGEHSNSFHLTFDDGMSEIYEVIAPLLLEKRLDATFFITTDFLDNKNLFFSHKVSLIANEVNQSPESRGKVAGFLKCPENQIQKKLYSHPSSINEIADLIHVNFDDYLQQQKPYCTTAQISELQKMGFTIGNHSKTHRNFNTLHFSEQKEEILHVNQILKEFDLDVYYFCFPYGDDQIKNELFHWMYDEGKIRKSFGISGMKADGFPNHLHRILMEHENLSAKEIISAEYLLYAMKSVMKPNVVKRC